MGSAQPRTWTGKSAVSFREAEQVRLATPSESHMDFFIFTQMTTGHSPESGRTDCTAMRDFKTGSQVFMHYGDRSNANLLVYSGFVEDRHTSDYLLIKLGVGKGSSLYGLKTTLLSNLGIPTAGEFVLFEGDDLDPQTQAFIRIVNMNQGKLSICSLNDILMDLLRHHLTLV